MLLSGLLSQFGFQVTGSRVRPPADGGSGGPPQR